MEHRTSQKPMAYARAIFPVQGNVKHVHKIQQ